MGIKLETINAMKAEVIENIKDMFEEGFCTFDKDFNLGYFHYDNDYNIKDTFVNSKDGECLLLSYSTFDYNGEEYEGDDQRHDCPLQVNFFNDFWETADFSIDVNLEDFPIEELLRIKEALKTNY